MKDLLRASLPDGAYRASARLWHGLQRLDPRYRMRKSAFDRRNRGLPEDQIAIRPGLHLAIDPRCRESFEWFCFRSIEMAAELDCFLAKSAGKTRFLDVGACHGIFSLAFTCGRPDATALAIEPSPLAQEILQLNVRLNGTGIVPIRSAVGAAAGSLRMRLNWHHLEAIAEDDGAGESIEVPVQTLDDLCTELNFRPDLVKIDVEGYEHSVLEGARDLLLRHRPTVFLEVHPGRLLELGRSSAALARLLEETGYHTRTLDGAMISARAFATRTAVFRVVCSPS